MRYRPCYFFESRLSINCLASLAERPPRSRANLSADAASRRQASRAVLLGKLRDNVEIGILIRLIEGNVQPEPVGKRYHLLHSVVAVDIVALPVREALAYDMPAVAGGVNGNI